MKLPGFLAPDPESRKWRSLRAAFTSLENLENSSQAWRMERGELWRVVPREQRNAREHAAMEELPSEMRELVETIISGYARFSEVLTYLALSDQPVDGFVEVQGEIRFDAVDGRSVTLHIDRALVRAPHGFARILAAQAAASAPRYVNLADAEGRSTWPSRSAMARLRRLWATTGDYPAPQDWNDAARALLSNAYWRAGIDHCAFRLSGERMTKQMADWADSQPHPHDPRYFPSWNGRFLAQQQDEKIFSD